MPKGKPAVIVLDPAWLVTQLWPILTPDAVNPIVPFKASAVILDRGEHGITVGSLRPDDEFQFSSAEIFIPWKFVMGILWHEDCESLKRTIGFGSMNVPG